MCEEVTYVGHRFTNEGLKPDPKKVRAITEMPTPVNAEAMRCFIRITAESICKRLFLNLSEVAKPLKDVVHKQVQSCWENSPARRKACSIYFTSSNRC